jgi:hypothetical protein
MSRAIVWIAIGLILVAGGPIGCALGPWGGPAYTFKAAGGEQAVELRNDTEYWNGNAMNMRRK